MTVCVDETGSLTGSEVVFVYPDWCTCYLGPARDGVLTQARRSTVASVRIRKVYIHQPMLQIFNFP